jgi:hypothetical protein
MSLFSTLVKYFMYSHLSYFLYIVVMLCWSEDEEFFDEDFFYVYRPPVICLWRDAYFSLFRHFGLLISFILRLDVINTDYFIYFTICQFMSET